MQRVGRPTLKVKGSLRDSLDAARAREESLRRELVQAIARESRLQVVLHSLDRLDELLRAGRTGLETQCKVAVHLYRKFKEGER